MHKNVKKWPKNNITIDIHVSYFNDYSNKLVDI